MNKLKLEFRNKDYLYQKYINENKSYDEIAEITGVSKQTIQYWIIKFKIPRKPVHRYKRIIDREILVQKYIKEKKTIREMAIILNKSEKTIRYQLKFFDISRRHPGFPKGIKIEEKHPNWKGDEAKVETGRARAYRWFNNKKPCEICDNPEGHRHHKDENTLNNNPQNIQWLCHKCHMKTHREKRRKINMPIKREKRKLYPENWDKLSLYLREKADWKCKLCQSVNGFPQKITGSIVVLTVHHINGNPSDNRKINLIVLCQRCHNILDQPFRRPNKESGKLFKDNLKEIWGENLIQEFPECES